MKLQSWNVNGFRAVSAKPGWALFRERAGDIVGLQETKAELSQVDISLGLHPECCEWHAATRKKGYSGVAVFSCRKPLAVSRDLPDPLWQGEGRLLHLEYPEFHYLNVYFPNGQSGDERLAYKLGYYDAFLAHVETLRKQKPIVVCGDFNTAHKPIDLARPKENEGTSGFLPIERAWMDHFVSHGYIDTLRHVHGDTPDLYSWWSYRMKARERNVGWRIDYFFVSSELKDAIRDAWIETDITGSDHCPVGLELAL